MRLIEWSKQTPKRRILLITAIIIIGFNLRPAITSVGPVLGLIRDDIGLSNWSAGLITSLPLLAFAITSPIAAKLGARLGNMSAVLIGLGFLLGGIITRSIPFTFTLFAGTFVVGVGIAIMNVLLPAVVKEKFPYKVGGMTSVYTTSMAVMAATASGLSIPLAKGSGFGWELSLGTWAILAVAGFMIWYKVVQVAKTLPQDELKLKGVHTGKRMWGSSLAWQVTLFMGLQSFVYYTIVSWFPEMLQDFGFSASTAGWMLSYVQFVSIPSTFLAPILAERYSHQKGIVLVFSGCTTVGFLGLLAGGPAPLIFLWITLVGIGAGATISLSLTLLSLRAATTAQAAQLSGMAQSVGYVLAAFGPMVIGLLYDITHTWQAPILTIVAVGIIMSLAGYGAGRDKYVLEEEAAEKA
ncbi:CynX/NimT family MFS transporter [Lentibacillus sp. JNUCC-1]|uniref:CynX/NimT family MFS transporter n=1 Tax=Lentibacillus sp. JNUCC-1 TaxID=2654513 RepID=UPI0012E96644|nr:MFS transporter [Lentibacillus sp. JNUCC-1]